MSEKPKVTIKYCVGCRWLLRAGWMAQEILLTFAEHLAEVAISPGDSGEFVVYVDKVLVWDRKVEGGFPEIKELKRRIRDRVSPCQSLGHCDI